MHRQNQIALPVLTTDLIGQLQLRRDPVRHHDVMVAQAGACIAQQGAPSTAPGSQPPICRHRSSTCLKGLAVQGSWVATDEMEWYLMSLEVAQTGCPVRPIGVNDDHAWLAEQWNNNCAEVCYAIAILINNHWEPWLLRTDGEVGALSTGPHSHERLLAEPAIAELLRTNSLDVTLIQTLSVFHADCGFQTMARLSSPTGTESVALGWRGHFGRSLIGPENTARSARAPAWRHAFANGRVSSAVVCPPPHSWRSRSQSGRHGHPAIRPARCRPHSEAGANACVRRIRKLQLVLPAELELVI